MTADRLATLARRAAADPGDAQAQAEWLRARVRAGELTRERVELAAYCGDAVALSVIGHGQRVMRGWPDLMVAAMRKKDGAPVISLADWLRGLARWGDEVMVRAAVAAQREVVRPWSAARPVALARLAEVESWLDGGGKPAWLNGNGDPRGAINSAVREAGEQPVREAIQRALIEWALSHSLGALGHTETA